ncbi:hypothetical protein FSP39_009489 [Pinctada imbricata]|uniref:Ankyrin repeat domain-containing protein 54 n=1 Tax=Pinctada imbricata TaxID=66713 RepID=A0AA89BQD8_PINIB|nr:hypothetical protein FSP39_009489 [Pinctada imbricata]
MSSSPSDENFPKFDVTSWNPQPPAVIQLLDSGVDVCCYDDKKRSPLHFAASQGYETIVKVLLDKGANPNQKDMLGNTALHLAACTGHVPVVTLLLRAGTDICSVDRVSEMMKTYLRLSGMNDDADQLDILCDQLRKVSTRVEMDNVNTLMADLASLSLEKKSKPP